MDIRTEVLYFSEPGERNTQQTLVMAKKRAGELGIKTIVVASTTGSTALKAMQEFKGYKVVVITHCAGYISPDTQEFDEKIRSEILADGGIIHTAAHSFGGIGRAVRRRFKDSSYQLDEIIAHVLRLFGQGVKVAIEVTLMAVDAGLVRTNEDVIAISGTSRGADTAIIIRPATTHDLFSIRIEEIICKPRL